MYQKDCFHRSLSRFAALCICTTILLAAAHPALAQRIRIIFLHHSCGGNLIEQGAVREGFTTLGHEFYDHGYNDEGLRLADGSFAGFNFDVPGDNTDPDGFASIFAQPLHDPPDNTFSYLMQYDVVAFKSCFPVSNIWDDGQLSSYKSHYLSIRDRTDQFPDKIFIIVTQPPQVPANSDPAEAERARAFTNWLGSNEYQAGHPNIFVFDFFDMLAGDDGFLRQEYRLDEYDAHPNERANQDIGPLFVSFIDQVITGYEAGEPRPTSVAPMPTAALVTEAPPPISEPHTEGLIDDFESGSIGWEFDVDGMGSSIGCGVDTGKAASGEASLSFQFDIKPGGWGGCGRSYEAPQDWSGAEGISMWMQSDEAGQWITLTLFAGDLGAPTPFEIHFEIMEESADNWTLFIFPWTDFERAEWADEGGLPQLEPSRVTGYGFSIGANEGVQSALWVDDVSLSTSTTQPPTAHIGEEPSPIEEQPAGGICPFSTILLPFGVVVYLTMRKRR